MGVRPIAGEPLDEVYGKGSSLLRLTEDQVLYFRNRRRHPSGPGASDAPSAARAMMGAQSQQLNPSLLALSMRMKDRPAAASLKKRLLEPPREMVRTWGQRDSPRGCGV